MKFTIIWLGLVSGFPDSVLLENVEMETSKLSLGLEGCNISSPIQTLEVSLFDRFGDERLGTNYNAINDRLFNDELFEISSFYKDFPDKWFRSVNITSSKIDFIETELFSGKFEKLGISPSLGLSFLTGACKSGCDCDSTNNPSLKYLCRKKVGAKSVTMSFIYKVRTVREELRICSDEILNLVKRNPSAWDFRWNSPFSEKHTHAVVGIEYGADTIVTVEYAYPDGNSINETEIREELKEKLNCIVNEIFNIDGPYYNCSKSHPKKLNRFYKSRDFRPHYILTVNGHFLDGEFFSTDFGINNLTIDSLRDVPKIVKNRKGGKGVPVNLILMPLVDLIKIYEIEKGAALVGRHLDETLTKQYFQLFEDVKESELFLKDANDFLKYYNRWSDYPGLSETNNARDMKLDFRKYIQDFKAKVRNHLVKYRMNASEDETLSQLITDYKRSNWTLESVKNYKKSVFDPLYEKIKWLHQLEESGAIIIENEHEELLIEAFAKEATVTFGIISLNINDLQTCRQEITSIVKGNSGENLGAKIFFIKPADNGVSKLEIQEYPHSSVKKSFILGQEKSCFL